MLPYNSLPRINLSSHPFPHFQIFQVFDEEVQSGLIKWLECSASWSFQESSFYQQMVCDVLSATLPVGCKSIVDPEALGYLRNLIGSVFRVEFSETVSLKAHKLLPGYRIEIHTDAPKPGKESYRMVVTFQSANQPLKGGDLVFFASNSGKNPSVKFPVLNNTAIAFALTEKSYHAVTPVEEGNRYSLIYSFWTRNKVV